MRTHESPKVDAAFRAFIAYALFLAAAALNAETAPERFARLYGAATSWSQRLGLIEEMVAANDPGLAVNFGAVLEGALTVERSRLDSNEQGYFDKALIAVSGALGRAGRIESAESLFRVATYAADPVARSEAIIALGRMRAKAYAEEISKILSRANAGIAAGTGAGSSSGQTAVDRTAAEKLAYGCVVSLGLMGELSGWREVFVASQAWYGPVVRKAAEQSLADMVSDPTEAVITVMKEEASGKGELALRYEMSSKAGTNGKAKAAIAAMTAGRTKDAGSSQDRAAAKSLRIAGIRALASLRVADGVPVQALRESWRLGDADERLAVLDALGANGSDAAADELYSIIEEMDQARRIGNVREDSDRMMKAALLSAGLSGNIRLKPVIQTVIDNDKWASGVLIAAYEAMEAIGSP
jgi:hypothetical protein